MSSVQVSKRNELSRVAELARRRHLHPTCECIDRRPCNAAGSRFLATEDRNAFITNHLEPQVKSDGIRALLRKHKRRPFPWTQSECTLFDQSRHKILNMLGGVRFDEPQLTQWGGPTRKRDGSSRIVRIANQSRIDDDIAGRDHTFEARKKASTQVCVLAAGLMGAVRVSRRRASWRPP